MRRSVVRGLFAFMLIFGTVSVVGAYTASPVRESTSQIQKAHQTDSNIQIAPPRENATLIVSDRRFNGQVESAVFILAPDGSLMTYNGTVFNYQDSDPIPDGRYAFFVLASDRPPQSDCPTETSCSINRFQKLNGSTGSVQTFYVEFSSSSGSKDWHDADRINDTHYLVGDIAEDSVFIVNVSSGKHVWTWNVSRAYNVSSGGNYDGDWTHLNDVEYLSDGRVMVNLRNQDQVVFLKPGNGLQESWTLGSDDDHDTLFEPHNPDYIPTENGGPAVLIADSENDRIIEYQRVNESWEMSWVWRDAEMRWPRDADRLPNGHTLIADSNRGRIIEVDRSGDIVWRLNTSMPYEAERVGTGPESTGGPSAVAANLTPVTEYGVVPGNQSRSGLKQYEEARQVNNSRLLANIFENPDWSYLMNGLLFISPTWIGPRELYVLFGMIVVVFGWGIVELYWARNKIARHLNRTFLQ